MDISFDVFKSAIFWTAFSSIVTAIVSSIAFLTLYLTWRPRVIVRAVPAEDSRISIEVKNVGGGSARNVELAFDPPFPQSSRLNLHTWDIPRPAFPYLPSRDGQVLGTFAKGAYFDEYYLIGDTAVRSPSTKARVSYHGDFPPLVRFREDIDVDLSMFAPYPFGAAEGALAPQTASNTPITYLEKEREAVEKEIERRLNLDNSYLQPGQDYREARFAHHVMLHLGYEVYPNLLLAERSEFCVAFKAAEWQETGMIASRRNDYVEPWLKTLEQVLIRSHP